MKSIKSFNEFYGILLDKCWNRLEIIFELFTVYNANFTLGIAIII